MNSFLGQLVAVGGLILSVVTAVLAFWSAGEGREELRDLSGDLCWGVLAAALGLFVIMEVALVTHDFSVSYVAQVGSRETPLLFTLASAWSALEGSILLWVLILAVYTFVFARWSRQRWSDEADGRMLACSLGTLLLVNVFFFVLLVGPADPFEPVYPVPENGPGPNPLLQNNWFMAVHPPILYVGYVGMSAPFALAVGGLVSRRLDRTWTRAIRSWTLFPWSFLTLGIVAGAWWSYEVLGWGGYWAWDPVENASLMPWLVGTAFLHSLMVQEQRKMLKTWTVSLIVATFLLTLLGTFLTRSGILDSVHAFTEGAIGPYFLGFMGLVALASLTLVAVRVDTLGGEGRLESALSRETAFLVNNLLFAALTFAVLVGTLFPLVVEAVQGQRVTVGRPFFDSTTVPLALGLIFLTGVGPALPWGKGPKALLQRKFTLALAAGAAVVVILLVLGSREPLALLTFGLAGSAVALLAGEFARPAAARRRAHGESWPRALGRLILSNRRRYGGYVVHLGVLVAAVGIAGSSVYRQVEEESLEVGARSELGRYTVRLDSVWTQQDPHRESVVAGVTVSDPGGSLGEFFPAMNYYPISPQPVGSPAVREHPVRDLYFVLAQFAPDHSRATIQLIISPLVWWLWAGGIVMGLGGLFAFLPRRWLPTPATAARGEDGGSEGGTPRART